jgi:hypothetical protein
LGSDFVNYELALQLSYSELASDFYYYKEPALWVIQKFLFSIFNSATFSWIAIDTLLYLFCSRVAARLRIDHVYVLIYFLSFYSILGLFNTYRQFLAMAILGWAGILYGARVSILVSVFFHWASLLSLALEKIKMKEGVAIILMGLFILSRGNVLFEDRASVLSGSIAVPIYCAILFLVFMSIFNDLKEPRFMFLGVALIFMQAYVESSYMERICLGLFQLIMPLAIKARLHNRIYMKIFYLFSIVMSFIHPSSLALMGFVG